MFNSREGCKFVVYVIERMVLVGFEARRLKFNSEKCWWSVEVEVMSVLSYEGLVYQDSGTACLSTFADQGPNPFIYTFPIPFLMDHRPKASSSRNIKEPHFHNHKAPLLELIFRPSQHLSQK